jgi:hypothetical protein
MYVKSLALALACSTAIGLHSGSAAAAYGPRCDGMGFALVDGHWIEDPRCEATAAARVARDRHETYAAARLRNDPAAADEFCRGNDDINASTFCAPYKD